ncbi:hypothetical protein AVEN_185401-1 [Araneus ventricosus]|uniref:Uncharacterized protein n=1 Tax=Araneus ventricosus TaxID=182803 RepID=A0A4Y2CHK4_ARAVE|nr:hypothetical protein AVEN_185401-1 [Araneus ventricosus]
MNFGRESVAFYFVTFSTVQWTSNFVKISIFNEFHYLMEKVLVWEVGVAVTTLHPASSCIAMNYMPVEDADAIMQSRACFEV